MRPLLIVVVCCFGLCACAETQTPAAAAPEQDSQAYGDSAARAYEVAMEDFREESCDNAIPKFKKVRREFSYSRYAALSELRVADCLLTQKKYPEAISAYRAFARTRPSHNEVPYAQFKIAVAYFNQIPSSFFLSPPPEERDQAATRDALRQIRRFILDYPEDVRVAEANTMAREALALLARHELYVAQFYLDHDHPQAAVARLISMLSTYAGSGIEGEGRLLLARTYLRMEDRDSAILALQELVARDPESSYAPQARRYLEDLGAPVPPSVPSAPAAEPANPAETPASAG